MVIYSKSCPRCGNGDCIEESDRSGKFIFVELVCIQCGFRRDKPKDVRKFLEERLFNNG